MSKKILIGAVVVIAAGAAFGLPWYGAGIAEQQFAEGFAPQASDCIKNGLVLKLDSYERGLFSSKAMTSITLKGMEKEFPPLQIEHQISNFPSFNAIATVNSQVLWQGKPLEGIPPIVTALHGGGNFDSSWKPADIDAKPVFDNQGKLTLKKAYLLFGKSAQGSKFDFNLDKVQLDSAMGQLVIAGVNYVGSQPGSMTCLKQFSGDGAFKIDTIQVNAGPMGGAELKNFSINATATDENDNVGMKMTTKFDLASASMLGEDLGKLSGFDFQLSLDNLSHSAYVKVLNAMNEMNEKFADEQDSGAADAMLGQLKPAALEMMKKSPSLSIPKFAFAIDSKAVKGIFNATGRVGINGEIVSDDFDLNAPPPPNLFSADAEIKVGKDLLASLIAGPLGDRVYDMAPMLGLIDPENPALDPDSDDFDPDAFSAALFDGLVQEGFLVDSGNDYTVTFKFDKGAMLLNGKNLGPDMAG